MNPTAIPHRWLPATLALLGLLTPAVNAAPVVDQNAGLWTDLYADTTGIALNIPETFGIRHDPFARVVALADNAPQSCRQDPCANGEVPGRAGQMATLPIAPVSPDGWRRGYIRFTASQASDVQVRFLGDNGTTYGPFTLQASDDAAWTSMFSLSGVPSTVLSGRLLVNLRERVVVQGVRDDSPDRPADDPADVRIRPTLQGLRANWMPRSVVRAAVEAPASTCANAAYTVRVRVAVSLVRAENLIVWAPLTAPGADIFSRTYPLQFRGASNNGQYVTANTDVNGVTVPANSVYWTLGNVDAGNTFLLSFNVAPPVGTLNATTYTASAQVRAANAAPAAAEAVATSTQSAPAPVLRKTASSAFLINNRYYIDGGRTLSYNLFIANWEFPPNPNNCTEAYHRVVVYDDVTDLVANKENLAFGSVYSGNAPSAFTISDGGQYTEEGTSLYGVTIPPRSIYWDVGTMEVGARRNLTFSVTLKDDTERAGPLPLNHLIENTAHLRSGHQTSFNTAAQNNSRADVYISIPNTPSGTYAKGDRIRGSSGLSAGNNDNWWLSVGYGDPVTFLLYAQNNGASQLANVVFVDKVPDNTTFSSAFLPASLGGTVYYNIGGAANANDAPPDFTVTTGAFGGTWTTTAPANLSTVRWVGFSVPRLASPYFPARVNPADENSPFLSTNAMAEVTVTVNQPTDGCPLLTVNNRGLFNTYGFVGVGQTNVTPITGIAGFAAQDDEPVQVKPLVPSFEFMNVGASSDSLFSSGNVTFSVNVPNRLSGGVETDTALDVVVTAVMPRLSLNGVLSHVPFVSATAPGGTVDLSGLPTNLVVRYPSISPDATRSISITVNVPTGFVSGSTIGLSAVATGRDDVCGPIQASGSRNVVVNGNPYLTVAKRATLGVAARGSEIEYVLSYTNLGDAVSTKTWIVDKIPALSTYAWANAVPNGGQVWFSDRAAPLLPVSMRAVTPEWTDALVRQNFFQGQNDGDGRVYPPGNLGQPTWVAFLVDNNSLTPAQFPSSGLSTVRWGVLVRENANVGDIVRNEAVVFSSELLPAISNETATIISDDPSLDVLRMCGEVVAAGEEFTYSFAWVNNSTNDDYNVQFIENLPASIEFVSATHTWNAAADERIGDVNVTPLWNPTARTLTLDVSRAIDPSLQTAIESFEGGEFVVRVRTVSTTPSGTFADIGGVALATDFTGQLALSLATGCRILVENADLFARININESSPVAGETVTYTATVSNEGANVAANTSVVVTLPVGVTFAGGAGSVLVTSPGWSFSGSSAPVVTTNAAGQQVLTWSVATNNPLIRTATPAGTFPGRSGDVSIAIQAMVGASVRPETTLTATVAVATTSGEDANYPNTATVTALTPLADPWILKTGPGFAQPGASITYRLRYGNESRQASGGVFLTDKLYDAIPADGAADVTLIGLTANNGETVYYNSALLTGNAPAFDPANPAATGWRTTASGGAVNWIGFHRTNLAGNAGPFSIFVDVALRAPGTGREPQAGATIPNVASIRFTEPTLRDQNPGNNTSTVETRTPGVDIAAALVCSPEGAFPGAVPGQEASVTLELRNNGTVTAYGLKLLWTPQDWFTVGSDDAAEVIAESLSGAAVALLDENGAPITGRVNWSRDGNAFVVGDASNSSARWYRKVGIPANSRVRVIVTGTVSEELVSGTSVAHALTVATDYRFDFDPNSGEVEEIIANNETGCQTTVYRADPMVVKKAAGVNKAEPFTTNDRIEYSIEYNNIGAAAANEVFIEDYLPENTGFVVGSLANLPEGTTVRYDDGSGAFNYAPVGAVGVVDTNVKAFRVNWGNQLPAPAGATFRQASRTDFQAGTFNGTAVSTDGERVIVTGRGGGNRGTYTTPAIPTDPTASVVEWGRIVVNSAVEDPDASVSVTVVDANSGEAIVSGLVPDASGAIEVNIDPLEHRRIQLRIDMVGAGIECSGDSGNILPIEMEYKRGPPSEVYSCADPDTFIGYIDEGDSDDSSQGVVWTRQTDGTLSGQRLPKLLDYEYAYFSLDDDTIIGEASSDGRSYGISEGRNIGISEISPKDSTDGTLAVWERNGGEWQRVRLPDFPIPEDFRSSQPEYRNSEGTYPIRIRTSEYDNFVGAYFRVGGEWQFRAFPEFAVTGQCDNARGIGRAVFLRCYDQSTGTYRVAEFRVDQPDVSAWTWLPAPAGVQAQNGGDFNAVFSEGLLTVQWNVNNGSRDFVYEWTGTEWSTSLLSLEESGINIQALYGNGFVSNTELVGGVYENSNGQGFERGVVFVKSENVWTGTSIPLPPGYQYSNTNQVGSVIYSRNQGITRDGSYLVYFQPWRSGIGWVDASFLTRRNADGTWTSTEFATFVEGATLKYVYGITPSGNFAGEALVNNNSQSLPTLWVPSVDASGAVTYTGRVDSVLNQNRWLQTVDTDLSPALRLRRMSCSADLMSGNNISWYIDPDDFTETTFTAKEFPALTDTTLVSRGRIESGAYGAFFGFNDGPDGYPYPQIFVPDAGAGLQAYTLPRDTTTSQQSYANWASPDFKVVAGYTVRLISGSWQNVALYWEYDASLDAYLLKDLPGAGDPDNRGYPHQDSNDGYQFFSTIGVRGQSRNTSNSEYSGVWAYTPGKATSLTWVTPLLPGIESADTSLSLYGGGDGYFVVAYNKLDPDGGPRWTYVIVEQDAQSASGLKFTDLPVPSGWEDQSVNIYWEGSIRSDVMTGAVVNPSTSNWTGMIWRREAGAWTVKRMTDTDYSYPYFSSRRRAGPDQLPLVFGDFANGNRSIMVPSATPGTGLYTQPTFGMVDGFTSFNPWSNSRNPWEEPRYWTVFMEGFVTGTFSDDQGRNVLGYQYLNDDLTWTAGILPGIESDDNEYLHAYFATPGPVIYGFSRFSGRDERQVAWYFPEGDMSSPMVVDLSAQFGTYANSGDGNRERRCRYNNRYFSKPDASGNSKVALHCDSNNGNTYAVVSGGSSGVTVAVTNQFNNGGNAYTNPDSELVPLFYGNVPAIIGCSRGGGVSIDATQVLFRTDVNPAFQYRVEVPNVCQTSVTNTATIYTSSPQVTSSNDRSTVTSAIETVDVQISLTADRGTVEVDDSINYTATVTNAGPGPARDVRLEIFLPAGDGSDTGRTVRRNVGTLQPGESRTFNESVYVTTEEPFLPLNSAASVTTGSIECDSANNAATNSVLTGSLPNVTIAVEGPTTWVVGTTSTWIATVINNGNSTAAGVIATIALPEYGTIEDVNISAGGGEVTCVPSGMNLVCTIGNLPALDREGWPVEIEIVLTSPTCGDIGDQASVSAVVDAILDANSTDNTSSASTSIVNPAGRLQVQAVPSRSTVETGDDITWFVHYSNTGTEAVSGVSLAMTLPAGVTLKADGTTAGYSVANGVVTWTLPAIPVGRGGIAAVAATVTGSAPADLTGSVALNLGDGANACPVSAPVDGTRITAPGIHVTKRANAAVGCSEPVDWLITVTNTSAAAVDNLVVTDRVPTQSPYVTGSIRGQNGSAQGNPVLSWTIPRLAAGQAVTLGFRSQAPNANGALVSNTAVVERGGQALATSSPAIVWATCTGAALRLAKSWDAGCVVNGQTVEVTVTATNTTQQALLTPAISDPLPQGFTFVASTTGATFDAVTGQVTQQAASVLGGQTVTMRYTATVNGAVGDVVLEAATGTAGGVQPQASNPVSAVVQNCNDNDPCTTDSCALFVGCVNTLTPIPGIADDNCDGVDNNCNAQTDEEWVDSDTTCGTGVCVRGGSLLCPTGATEPFDTCEAGQPTATADTLCNGLDDDCDGSTDEQYVSYGFVCGDTCAGIAPTACVRGAETWNCAAAPATVLDVVCDDGNACSDASTCDGAGNCRGRRFISCDDLNACTADSCDPSTGCVFDALTGTACSDFNLCTNNDICQDGTCVGDNIPCAAPGECQGEGVCNPATGVCDFPILPGDIPVPVSMRDLGTLGGAASKANAANVAGLVVGHSDTVGGQVHAFAWTRDGGMIDLTPMAASADATGVNDSGLVVGVMTMADAVDNAMSAFGWHADDSLVVLFSGDDVDVFGPNAAGLVAGQADGTGYVSVDGQSAATALVPPTGGTDVEVLGLGTGGHVVGRFSDATGATTGFRWSTAGGFVATTALEQSEVVAVNTSGQAVGMAMGADSQRKAYLFNADGTNVGLGTLGGDESWAVAINDAGVVIGQGQTATGETHGFVWTAVGGMRDLGSLGGASSALFINQAGMIAGQSDTVFGTTPATAWMPDDTLFALDLVGGDRARPVALTEGGVVAGSLFTALGERAFIWDMARGTEDVGTLGGARAMAVAANAAGQVVGAAETGTGDMHAFMTTVPETACIACDEDVTAPVIYCPQVRRALECNFGGIGVDFGSPSVSDACGRPVKVTNDAPETYEVGNTVVTYVAVDSEGNTASCTTTVVVEDTTPPVLDCPTALEVVAEPGVCGADVVLPVTATDGCDGDTVSVFGPAGDIADVVTFAPGQTTVNITAVDVAGNQSTCSFVVDVVDVSTLIIACDEDLEVEAPADFCGYPEAIVAEVTDGCGASMTLESASETFPLGVTDVEFTATNRIGETASCTTRLTVVDVTEPTIDCGTGDTLQELPAVFSPTGADACAVETTVANARCIVTDADGNATTVTEGCDIEVQNGNVLVVNAVPVYIDGVAIPVEAISIAWDVTATDPSSNSATTACESDLDLSNRDRDGDGVIDTEDNCPDTANADQVDMDLDGIGDVCDQTPNDGLVALGSGCAGGESPVGAGILLLALMALAVRARRKV